MDLEKDWNKIRRYFRQYRKSSFHFSISTISPDGNPWITPIGSLLLNHDGTGTFFEIFTNSMPTNLDKNQKVVIMGVNSGLWYWIRSTIAGRFKDPPALRLIGTAGKSRKATESEKKRLRRILSPFRMTKGYHKMWGNLDMVRDIKFQEVAEVNLGSMKAW